MGQRPGAIFPRFLFMGNEFVGMTGGKNAEWAVKHFGAWKGASPVHEIHKVHFGYEERRKPGT